MLAQLNIEVCVVMNKEMLFMDNAQLYTLYIFYYYIVVYIYCMHLSGQKSTCFLLFYC